MGPDLKAKINRRGRIFCPKTSKADPAASSGRDHLSHGKVVQTF